MIRLDRHHSPFLRVARAFRPPSRLAVLGIDVGYSRNRPSTGLCVIVPGDPSPCAGAHVRAGEASPRRGRAPRGSALAPPSVSTAPCAPTSSSRGSGAVRAGVSRARALPYALQAGIHEGARRQRPPRGRPTGSRGASSSSQPRCGCSRPFQRVPAPMLGADAFGRVARGREPGVLGALRVRWHPRPSDCCPLRRVPRRSPRADRSSRNATMRGPRLRAHRRGGAARAGHARR